MSNQADQPTQEFPVPSDKLVLPAPPEQTPGGQTDTNLTRPVPPIRRGSSPISHGLLSLLRSFWNQEPASRILGLAIALVLTASLILVVLGASTLSHATTSHPLQTSSKPTAVHTPTMTAPTMTVQITDISDSVENGKTVHVQVQTSKPGVSVMLQIAYQVPPFSSTSGPQITDSDGQATIDWSASISSLSSNINATVTAVATDQNGQQVTSSPMTVMITNRHHGDNNN